MCFTASKPVHIAPNRLSCSSAAYCDIYVADVKASISCASSSLDTQPYTLHDIKLSQHLTGYVLSNVHGNGNGPQPAVHAEELDLSIVALEQSHKDQPQQDEDASYRLQSNMQVLVSTAQTRALQS